MQFRDDAPLLRLSLTGFASGVLATLPMSAVMLVAGAMGLLGTTPPRRVVDEAVNATRAPGTPSPVRNVLAAALHLAFGGVMALGVLPVLARVPKVGSRGVRLAATGAAFGAALYALNYVGLAPALGVLPAPTEDRPGRQPTMLAAHLVYGSTLGALLDRLTRIGG
jgi:hypothetical protein